MFGKQKLKLIGLESKLFNAGTMRYMAPEIILANSNSNSNSSPTTTTAAQQHTYASDIFSLSIVLWELANQCTPYWQMTSSDEIEQAIIKNINLIPMQEQPQQITTRVDEPREQPIEQQQQQKFSKIDQQTTVVLHKLLDKCRNPNPLERPTAEQVLTEITRLMGEYENE